MSDKQSTFDQVEALELLKWDYEKKAKAAAKQWDEKAKKVEAQIVAILTDIEVGDYISWESGNGRRYGFVASTNRTGYHVNFTARHVLQSGEVGRLTEVGHWRDVKKEKK